MNSQLLSLESKIEKFNEENEKLRRCASTREKEIQENNLEIFGRSY